MADRDYSLFSTIDPKISYRNEQMTLNDFEADYKNFPKPSKEEPVEWVLLRCLIMALLSDHQDGAIKATLPEFNKVTSQEDVAREVEKLKVALNRENRTNAKISEFLKEISTIGTQKQKKGWIVASTFDYLIGIKQQLIPIDVADLDRLIRKTKEVEKEIEDKNIFLFIGETGSGKTTTVKALLGYKMGKSEFKGMNWVTIVEPVTDKKVLDMHSNPSCKSITRYIVAVKPKPQMNAGDVYLTDTPGWGDTAGVEVQLANFNGVKRALRGCRTVVPVIVISKESWGTRGMGIRNLGRTISLMFQNYEAIKQSVVIVMNRFTKDEIDRMEASFKDIIDNTNPSDKADKQLMSFLTHLHSLAQRKRLLSFEPLESDAKKLVEMLIERPTLEPGSVFKNTYPAQDVIKNFCVETQKRIKYHLDNQDITMVKHFIDSMKQLEEILNEESIGGSLRSIQDTLQGTLQKEFDSIAQDFNTKMRTLSLTAEDVQNYNASITKLNESGKKYKDIVPPRDWGALAERNFSATVNERATWFMNEKREEDKYRSLNTLKTLMLLHREMPFNRTVCLMQADIAKWITEGVESQIRLYSESLKKGQYKEAVNYFGQAIRNLQYQGLLSVKGKEEAPPSIQLEAINGVLLEHVRELINNGKGFFKRIHANISKVAEVDRRLNQISGCFELMYCQPRENVDTIMNEIKGFTEAIKAMSDEEVNKIMGILDKAQVHPVNEEVVENFRSGSDRLNSLRSIESIKTKATEQQETVDQCLGAYLRSQQKILKNVIDSIKKNPQELKNYIESVDTALKGIEFLGQFGQEETVASSKKIQDETLKQLRLFTPRFFEAINAIPRSFKFNVANNDYIVRKIYEGKEMEEIFQKLSVFRSEYDELKRRNIQNETILKEVLFSVVQSFRLYLNGQDEDLLKRYQNLNLNSVEMSLKFVQLVAHNCPFEDLRTKAEHDMEDMRKMFISLNQSFQHALCNFKDNFMNDKGSKLQSPTKSSIRQRADEVGERSRIVWKHTRGIFQKVKDIGDNYPTICELSDIDTGDLRIQFYEQVDHVIESIARQWEQGRGSRTNDESMNVLLQLCKIFRESDSDCIERRVDEFLRLRQQIKETISQGMKRKGVEIERLIEKRRFNDLKDVLAQMKLTQSDSQVYWDAMDKVKDFSEELLLEMKTASKDLAQSLKDLKEGCLDIKKIDEYYVKQLQLVSLLQCYQTAELKRVKLQFQRLLQSIVPNISEEVQALIQSDQIDEASKILRLLYLIEKNMPFKMERSANYYEELIAHRLESVEARIDSEDLDKEDYKYLAEFFKNNPNKEGRVRRLSILKGRWESKLQLKVEESISKLENARLEKDMLEAKRNCDDFCKLLTGGEIDSRKRQVELAYEKSKRNCNHVEEDIVVFDS